MRRILIALILFAAVLPLAAPAQDRVALVIGNAHYAHASDLRNPHRDADAMATTLRAIGFDLVRVLTDLDEDAFEDALAAFEETAAQSEIALVFFSGHGLQIDGRNYLIPVDARLERPAQARSQAVDLEEMRDAVRGARRLSVVILDACRTNDFPLGSKSAGAKGLIRPQRVAGNVVAFAAEAGTVAWDGEGSLSPYTRALTEALRANPSKEVRFLFTELAAKTREYAGRQQTPDAVFGNFPAGARLSLAPPNQTVALPPKTEAPVETGPYAVSEAQGLLNRLGYDTGLVDGAMGPRMRHALQAFQQQNGLAPTGQADTATLRALRVAARYHGGGAQLAVGVPDPEREPPAAPPQRRQYRDLSTFRDCPDCPEMVVIPAGRFWMGSPEDEEGRFGDEGPQRRVAIGKFALSRTEVTFDQWQACVEDDHCRSHRKPRDEGWGRGSRPVIGVSWDDIAGEHGYVAWMNSKVAGTPYRLPSEAEWEYAARADRDGSKNPPPFHFGATISTAQANYNGNFIYGAGRRGVYRRKTVPVDDMPLAENRWGLRHMHGNVWEWVADCWHGSYSGAPMDGSAWMEAGGGDCSLAILRGGSGFFDPNGLRSANRHGFRRVGRSWNFGFRLARTLSE